MIEESATDTGLQGRIVNATPVSADVVTTNRAEYCISKAGLAMTTMRRNDCFPLLTRSVRQPGVVVGEDLAMADVEGLQPPLLA